MATWITPWSSRSVKLDGTRTRRYTIGLIPVSQNLTWRIALASAARFSVGTRGFGRRFMLPDYCLSASPSPDTPEILMLSLQPECFRRACGKHADIVWQGQLARDLAICIMIAVENEDWNVGLREPAHLLYEEQT